MAPKARAAMTTGFLPKKFEKRAKKISVKTQPPK